MKLSNYLLTVAYIRHVPSDGFSVIAAAIIDCCQKVGRRCPWNYIESWRGFQNHPLISPHGAKNCQAIPATWESKSDCWQRTRWTSANCPGWDGPFNRRNTAVNRLLH